MSEPPEERTKMERDVEAREQRKLRARQEQKQTVWFGLGMFGMIGWSVSIPTVLGIALGVWIDARWPSGYSWTLMLMVAGLGLGCLNAWTWVEKESRRD